MRFSLYIAKRYLFTKSSNNAINIITGIAAVGVIVGAMSLFIVLSGFSGLKDFSLEFSSIFDSDLKVSPKLGKTFLISKENEIKLQAVDGIASFSKIIEERVFLNFKGKNAIAFIKGVDENYQKVNAIDSTIIVGEWFEQEEKNVVMGIGISSTLSLGVYDYSELLEVFVPTPGTGQITDATKAFQKERVMASGIYHVNEELNSKYVFSNFNLAKKLLSLSDDEVSAVEIKLTPLADESAVISDIQKILKQDLVYKNRIQQNDALYKMLNTENLAVYLIFTLVLIIALFNVVGSIIMMILDKKHNLKTLFNLGTTISEIRKIFFMQGVLMTLLGGILGILLGVLIVILQMRFNLVMITNSLPYPVKLDFINVLVVFSTITVLGVLASKIASGRVNENMVVN
ncbi:MAG: ABC transporter permease [Bacteroidetes bacterium HGW-Bacteroidetes-2]|nr:MAG: ABC transporter permease [Bacteroidetes bacterium HGW-Bacteroidetes-2]